MAAQPARPIGAVPATGVASGPQLRPRLAAGAAPRLARGGPAAWPAFAGEDRRSWGASTSASPPCTRRAVHARRADGRDAPARPEEEMPLPAVEPSDSPLLIPLPASEAEAQAVLARLVEEVRVAGAPPGGLNVVAFSGGVDSSLAAWLVWRAFGPPCAAACIGLSPALPAAQLAAARAVAANIGIPLWEVITEEGSLPVYVANVGQSCYACKSTLYSTLRAVAAAAAARAEAALMARDSAIGGSGELSAEASIVLFNGQNADDVLDPTRVGLVAAREHRVCAPLARAPKATVRALARAAGLPNWQLAAAPCLRSRLAYGVAATPEALGRTEVAEALVRERLQLGPESSMRVRTLLDGALVVEVEPCYLEAASALLPALAVHLGLSAGLALAVRPFQSGSLSRGAAPAPVAGI